MICLHTYPDVQKASFVFCATRYAATHGPYLLCYLKAALLHISSYVMPFWLGQAEIPRSQQPTWKEGGRGTRLGVVGRCLENKKQGWVMSQDQITHGAKEKDSRRDCKGEGSRVWAGWVLLRPEDQGFNLVRAWRHLQHTSHNCNAGVCKLQLVLYV